MDPNQPFVKLQRSSEQLHSSTVWTTRIKAESLGFFRLSSLRIVGAGGLSFSV